MRPSPFVATIGLLATAAAEIRDGAWRELAPITDHVRQEHSVVALGRSTLYLLGGIVHTAADAAPAPGATASATTTTTALVQAYDIASDTWSARASLPAARNHLNCAAAAGRIYCLGGLRAAPDGGGSTWHGVDDVSVYDPVADAWAPATGGAGGDGDGDAVALPPGTGRGAAVTAVQDDAVIWMAGGVRRLVRGAGGAHLTTASVTAYNATAGAFLDLPAPAASLPEARDHAVGGIVGSRFFVAGGRIHGQPNMRNTTYYLDLEDLEQGWITTDSHMPTARAGAIYATVGELLYTFGGEVNYNSSNGLGVWDEVEVLNTTDLTWTSLSAMKVPRHGFNGVAVDGVVYMPGGGMRNNSWPTNYTDAYILPGF